MFRFLITAALAAVVQAQANTTYANYSAQAQPDLTPQTVALIRESFPDCSKGPLKKNLVCNVAASYQQRAAALMSALTLEELINQTGNTAYGVPRLGLPPYQVWSEALHGLDRANFSMSGPYKWATSFPMPILTMAGLNRSMVNTIATLISTQARAFNNDGRYGLDVYAPNINGFRSPIWGRGQETPGEDAFLLSSAYAYEYITGMQGGVNPDKLKMVATPKHFVGYDLENWNNRSRLGNDLAISSQDLAGYYAPQFKTSIEDAKAQSLMCSYNAVNGVPSCASSFFLRTVLRDQWHFTGYVSTDCDAAYNVYNPHMYAANESQAAADSVLAGADIDCGTTYQYHLNESVSDGLISRKAIEKSVGLLYEQLVRLGYFDPPSEYRRLTWQDVLATDARNISYEAAVEGVTLLKNDGTLPLSKSVRSLAIIGPYANASDQLQGNYFGPAPYLTSPVKAAQASGLTINYAYGTQINTVSTVNFSQALKAARNSDAIVFLGGIDNTIEAEGQDRLNLTWPGNQLDLISKLSAVGKPLVVVQMGGGQVDSTALKNNAKVNSLIWGGYPGQSGGQAIFDILTGRRAPAGRLVSTQYPANYVFTFDQDDLSLRPNKSTGNPGQTYMWYTGKPVYPFGHGLFYTTFKTTSTMHSTASYDIGSLASSATADSLCGDPASLLTFTVNVANTGKHVSDYTAMLFASSQDAGPAPYPNKWLVGFERIGNVMPGKSSQMKISVPVAAMARTDKAGDSVLYPGTYKLALNNEESVVMHVTLKGKATTLSKWPAA